MTTKSAIATNEVQIRQLIAEQQRAICTKNVEQIVSHYANEVIVFDVKPPFQTQGKDALSQVWKECLPYFPDAFEIETRDLKITVSEDLAVAHWLFRFTGTQDHPAMQTWMRVTAVCQKNQGEWQMPRSGRSPLDGV
nr:DUF4440 domain-containing protein [Nostoc sp. ChiQUE02]MDZ8232340.1 nuclear transport factor 2 family protein [Nostoc sp. ChiQUE02]